MASSDSRQKPLRERLPDVLHDIGTGYWEVDLKHGRIFLSEVWWQIHGLSPRDGWQPLDFWQAYVHPDDMGVVKAAHERATSNTGVFEVEARVKHTEKGYVYVRSKGVVIKGEDGEPRGMVGTLEELSSGRSVEEFLRERNQMLEDMAHNIQGLIMRYHQFPDGSNEIKFISKLGEEIWELTRNEMMEDSRKVWDKVHPDDLENLLHSINESARDEAPWKAEYRAIMDDGRVKWIRGTGMPQHREDGSTIWNSLAVDITEEKRQEAEMRKLVEQLHLCIKTAKIGISETDLQTSKTHYNEELRRIFAIEPGREITEEVFDRFMGEDNDLARRDYEKVLAGEVIQGSRLKVLSYDNKVKYLHSSAGPIFDDRGKVIKVFGINVEITDLVEKEKALQQALDEKEQLFQEVHHRVKNNLQWIDSFLSIKRLSIEDKEMADFLKETSLKIGSISRVHEFLLQSDSIQHIGSKGYLASLVEHIVLTYKSPENKVEVESDIEDHEIPVDVMQHLGLITNEVLINVIKHAYPDIVEKRARVSFALDGKDFRLEVSDNGIGINEESFGKQDSFGTKIIEMLLRGIDGTMEARNDGGTKITILFPKRK